jgi:tripartite-type tricarboxylate transporter receptor subunit TctC
MRQTLSTTPAPGAFRVLLACAAIAFAVTPAAQAQDAAVGYPDRPIKFLVPFGPGGAADVVARVLVEKLGLRLGQPVVIENRPGAGGALGSGMAARSKPDGYTLLLGFDGILTVAPTVLKNLPYDTVKDFQPVTKLVDIPIMVVAHPSVKAKNLAELAALSKKEPGTITFATTGSGTTMHLAGELLKKRIGLDWRHVPYGSGSGKALIDLLGGFTSTGFFAVSVPAPHIKDGKLVGLGVASPKRSPVLPDVPTFRESGITGMDASAWIGLLVPAGTPRAIVDKLNREVSAVMNSPEVAARLQAMALEPATGTPEAFGEVIKSDLARWAQVVKDGNIVVEQ